MYIYIEGKDPVSRKSKSLAEMNVKDGDNLLVTTEMKLPFDEYSDSDDNGLLTGNQNFVTPQIHENNMFQPPQVQQQPQPEVVAPKIEQQVPVVQKPRENNTAKPNDKPQPEKLVMKKNVQSNNTSKAKEIIK